MDLRLPAYFRIVIVLLGVVLIVIIMRQAKIVLVPLLIAGLFSILISPLTVWLENKRLPSALAVITSLIVLIVFLLGAIYFFYNQILGFAGDLGALERRVSEFIETINIFLANHIEGTVPISMDNIRETIFKQIYENMDTLTQGIIATAGTITMILIMPIYIFLFLYYRKFLAEFIKRTFPEHHKEKVIKVLNNVKYVVQNYIKGMFLVICILAVLNSIALFSLGIKHALLFAVFAALLNVIPFLGPFLGAVFPILYALLTKDSLWYPFGVFIAFYIIQLAESNFFTPKIVGGKVSMNPLMTIIALFIGNFIWGLAGMVLFIPGMAVLKVIFDEIEGMEPYGFLLGTVKDDFIDETREKSEPVLLTEIKKRLNF
jgi:predicted PurR-regulated permease PerM